MKVPSPKVSLILIITVLIVTGIISFKKNTEPVVDTNNELKLDVQLNIKDNLSIDSDNDGLSDWEESLWSSDPNNSDTDNDGTNDGDEVNLNRNPNIPGPDDENIDLAEEIIKEITTIPLDENGLTNVVAKNFIEEYFSLRSQGELSEEVKQKLVNSLIEDTLNSINIDSNRYKENQFITFDPSNKDKILEYAQSFYDIMLVSSLSFENAINNNSYSDMSKVFVDVVNKLTLLPVPEPIVSTHSKLTNDYLVLSKSILTANSTEEDPILASIAILIYYETQEEVETLVEDIALFLTQNGIIYEDGEINFE